MTLCDEIRRASRHSSAPETPHAQGRLRGPHLSGACPGACANDDHMQLCCDGLGELGRASPQATPDLKPPRVRVYGGPDGFVTVPSIPCPDVISR